MPNKKSKQWELTELSCKTCNQIKPKTPEFFQPNYKRSDDNGNCLYSNICKVCRTIYRQNLRSSKILTAIGDSVNFAKSRAFKKDLPFNITKEFIHNLLITQEFKCALTGIDLTFIKNKKYDVVHTNFTIDRIDSKKGYTIDNVQMVCRWANMAKTNLPTFEFINYCKMVISKNQVVV